MVNRSINLPKTHSFFLLGARGTGKTSLVREGFLPPDKSAMYIDLLESETENTFLRNPDELWNRAQARAGELKKIIIDEVQKVPRLLDVVHRIMEDPTLRTVQCILTGSSARKIKRGSANLLAGRAFFYELFPFTSQEVSDVSIEELLEFGTLPKIFGFNESGDKRRFLKAYTLTYLKEEIWNEQIVRQLEPFNAFLEIAAQHNGQPINFSRIAHDIGVATKTVQSYYQILEDTLIGFTLKPFHRSLRKQQKQAPKFYLFDCGIIRSLRGTIDGKLVDATTEFGDLFESFIIHELWRLFKYAEIDAKFSFLRTNGGAEIDLIIEVLGKLYCIEIKSKKEISKRDITHLISLGRDLQHATCYCLSRVKERTQIENVTVVPWREGIELIVKR